MAAEQEVARCRAEVNRLPARVDLLAEALSSSSAWDRSVALDFLRVFPDDVPALLHLLVDLTLSPAWTQQARQAIREAGSGIDPSHFARVALECLSGAEAEDQVRLADVLAEVGAGEALAAVIGKAVRNDDVDMKGEDSSG
ncbi:hypothetical protein ACIQPS_06025 [Streptomyces sp. NPDC091290]|uniref:hypothetical protein n=1 Tax=Streptomyces sp. NPDC091290 TaxID=3365990 RepID=UPI00380160DA